jgi:AcrR family transcriptional regulator
MTKRNSTPSEGLRERKRRETAQRITNAGINLFIQNGYDATTLDDIAAASGISRRTFFYYFKSKDDILLSLQAGMGEMIAAGVRTADKRTRPLHAIRDAMVNVCATIPPDDMIALDRLMRSSEVVQARKQASYVQHEKTLFTALQDIWPDPEEETALRLTAMMAIGALRLSTDIYNREAGQRSFVDILTETFAALETQTR